MASNLSADKSIALHGSGQGLEKLLAGVWAAARIRPQRPPARRPFAGPWPIRRKILAPDRQFRRADKQADNRCCRQGQNGTSKNLWAQAGRRRTLRLPYGDTKTGTSQSKTGTDEAAEAARERKLAKS